MAEPTQVDLSSIITPDVLSKVFQNRLPWPKEAELDFSVVGPYFWTPSPTVSSAFNSLVHPILKHLTSYPLQTLLAHDFLQYLPTPSSPSFPTQALALQLLLDQGGRTLRRTDERYKYDFFDRLSIKLAHQLLKLPANQTPHSKTRWLDEQHATLGFWMLARLWLQAPLQHSEDLSNHDLARTLNAEVRSEIEAFLGVTDPIRSLPRKAVLEDTLAYPRWTVEGPPGGPGTTLQDFAFWELAMMDVHRCIILTYGGYPQRFAARGREASAVEKAYLVRTGGFDVIDDEAAAVVREDVRVGRWTPLTVGGPSS